MAVPPSAPPENENPTNISVSLGDQWSDSLKGYVAKEVVVSFNNQLAENQNHNQTLFLQVLGVLVTVLVGFGYLYVHVGDSTRKCCESDVIVSIETLYWFLLLSMCLLSMSIAMVCNMAYGFRRDQLVVCNIRRKSGVMQIKNMIDDEHGERWFPESYCPKDKDDLFEWMPGFHKIFFVSLVIVKIILIFSVIFHPGYSSCCRCGDLPCVNILVAIAWLTIVLDACLYHRYCAKWKETSRTICKDLHL